jgi:hypothetical protein
LKNGIKMRNNIVLSPETNLDPTTLIYGFQKPTTVCDTWGDFILFNSNLYSYPNRRHILKWIHFSGLFKSIGLVLAGRWLKEEGF